MRAVWRMKRLLGPRWALISLATVCRSTLPRMAGEELSSSLQRPVIQGSLKRNKIGEPHGRSVDGEDGLGFDGAEAREGPQQLHLPLPHVHGHPRQQPKRRPLTLQDGS